MPEKAKITQDGECLKIEFTVTEEDLLSPFVEPWKEALEEYLATPTHTEISEIEVTIWEPDDCKENPFRLKMKRPCSTFPIPRLTRELIRFFTRGMFHRFIERTIIPWGLGGIQTQEELKDYLSRQIVRGLTVYGTVNVEWFKEIIANIMTKCLEEGKITQEK